MHSGAEPIRSHTPRCHLPTFGVQKQLGACPEPFLTPVLFGVGTPWLLGLMQYNLIKVVAVYPQCSLRQFHV